MFFRSLRIGFFLAVRYVRGASIWTTLLIIFIMILTFLNVVVVRGVLVGLPEGAQLSYEQEYAGNVIITPLPDKAHIESTPYVVRVVRGVDGYEHDSVRYIESGILEANYTESRKQSVLPDQVAVQVVGIDVDDEDVLTQLSSRVVEGEYLRDGDTQGIMVGYQLLDRYSVGGPIVGSDTLSGVDIGDRVRISIEGERREYILRGVIKGKVGNNARRVFMLSDEAARVMNRFDKSADEIVIQISSESTAAEYREKLERSGILSFASVQTAVESQGQFLDDIRNTFSVLSNIIGAIGIAVATITVFIVIFIFAITRQKQIGILKGIGINHIAIESSYVFLSIFYALVGVIIGGGLLYGFIHPYIMENPIDFPFADGILLAPYIDTVVRSVYILIATVLAGYIPSRLIVRKNTINSILGR